MSAVRINFSLIERAQTTLLSRELPKHRLDKNGDVIRDYNSELSIYCKDEADNILSKTDHNHFLAHQKLAEHLSKDSTLVIKKISNPVVINLVKDRPELKHNPIKRLLKVLNLF